jgi:hypothetical protein
MIKGDVIRRGFNIGSNNEVEEDSSTRYYTPYPTFKDQSSPGLDPEMTLMKSFRDNGIFIFVSNVEDYGHLVNPDTFTTTHKHNDLYEIYTNRKDWERRYIHPNYTKHFESEDVWEQPCPDVYWFPVVTDVFCQHLIEEMENFGQWSSGTNNVRNISRFSIFFVLFVILNLLCLFHALCHFQDERLAGGYENVPTRDIHMNQVGLEQQWLFFLREYIRPVQEKVFIGYFHDVSESFSLESHLRCRSEAFSFSSVDLESSHFLILLPHL